MQEQENKIYQVDKNFLPPVNTHNDIEYYDILSPQFKLHGLITSMNGEDGFTRLPKSIATAASEGVAALSRCTAGGRVRFATNSSVVVIKYKLNEVGFLGHMPRSGSCGADVYSAPYGERVSSQIRVLTVIPSSADTIECSGTKDFGDASKRDFTVNLPLYNGISEMQIGIKSGSEFFTPTDYTVTSPVMFYGSSITQGGCASRPGNAYFAMLGRMLDCDYYCLGFSGNAKGEQILAEYIGAMRLSAFVYDYDHNAPDLDHLKKTHYSFYETVRRINPSVPIIFVSKPDFDNSPQTIERRDLILSSYLKAKKSGDDNVSFVDGETLFGSNGRDECTVDGCHPNDLGFYRMAEAIYPKLKKALY